MKEFNKEYLNKIFYFAYSREWDYWDLLRLRDGLKSLDFHFQEEIPSKEGILNYAQEFIDDSYAWAWNCGDDRYEVELDTYGIECMKKVIAAVNNYY